MPELMTSFSKKDRRATYFPPYLPPVVKQDIYFHGNLLPVRCPILISSDNYYCVSVYTFFKKTTIKKRIRRQIYKRSIGKMQEKKCEYIHGGEGKHEKRNLAYYYGKNQAFFTYPSTAFLGFSMATGSCFSFEDDLFQDFKPFLYIQNFPLLQRVPQDVVSRRPCDCLTFSRQKPPQGIHGLEAYI